MKLNLSQVKKRSLSFLVFLLIINIFLFTWWLSNNKQIKQSATTTRQYPEINELENRNPTFSELKEYFTNLAEKKGAEYAFSILKLAPVPPNTDMHLLGHVVGDMLYKQQGLDGIKICTQDFRNACSHSIVVGLLLDRGDAALADISLACKQSPGGSGAYTMCYHGLGHGILSYTNFELPEAVKLCQKTGTEEYRYQESSQCVGGAIMEITSGGDHDKKLWTKQRNIYLNPSDPLRPCFSDYLPIKSRQMCITYITPYLWEAVGANLGNPTDLDFQSSFKFCSKIKDSSERDICFGGFGKDFVGLAAARDIRKVDQMSDDQFLKVYNWCKLADNQTGIESCLVSALSSIFWGGENDRQASIRFCGIINDPERQKKCFLSLIDQVSYYIKDPNYRQSFCQELPNKFMDECKKRTA